MAHESGDEDDDRTVYQPRKSESDESAKPEAPDEEDKTPEVAKPADDPDLAKTQFMPPPAAPATDHEPTQFAAPSPPASPPPPPKKSKKRQFADGDVLNGIYRISRFIARGGMGEVYEATNIHQQAERVAIKVMLPHLAQDEMVAAMFAKEAEMLTRLHHEAIVPYRMAARDAEGKPYIVTEFIPGPSLEEKLGKFELSEDEFANLAQKLAAGLGTAHNLGAIHRDIAPDNILLADGDPARPKIIDFGIARDARENTGTIVGEGFAGKLKYVAPEQLGEFDRNVGPWTDLYSLALTLRAVATGAHSDMGGSLSDAVRKRQEVPDLAIIPERFRPAFEMALQPDPANRPQSMAEFILRLGDPFGEGTAASPGGGLTSIPGFGSTTGLAPKKAEPKKPKKEKKAKKEGPSPTAKAGAALSGVGSSVKSAVPSGLSGNPMVLIGGGVAALLLAIVGLVVFLNLGGNDEPGAEGAGQQASSGASAGSAPGASADQGVDLNSPQFQQLASTAIANVDCAWLSYTGAEGGAAKFVGGAANPAAAQNALVSELEKGGVGSLSIDFGRVVSFDPKLCSVLDALREVRSEKSLITSPQEIYETKPDAPKLSNGSALPQGKYAKVLVRVAGVGANEEYALFALDTASEGISVTSTNRRDAQEFAQLMQGNVTGDGLVFTLPVKHEKSGKESFGLIVVSGSSALPAAMVDQTRTYGDDWARQFREGARANGWKSDIVWFSIEDRQRDSAADAANAAESAPENAEAASN